jgi:hypothetical protein
MSPRMSVNAGRSTSSMRLRTGEGEERTEEQMRDEATRGKPPTPSPTHTPTPYRQTARDAAAVGGGDTVVTLRTSTATMTAVPLRPELGGLTLIPPRLCTTAAT